MIPFIASFLVIYYLILLGDWNAMSPLGHETCVSRDGGKAAKRAWFVSLCRSTYVRIRFWVLRCYMQCLPSSSTLYLRVVIAVERQSSRYFLLSLLNFRMRRQSFSLVRLWVAHFVRPERHENSRRCMTEMLEMRWK